MILYQRENSQGKYHNDIRWFENFQFVSHIHRDPELIYVKAGELTVTVEGRSFPARAGQMALVFSNQIHAYSSAARNLVAVHVFSEDNVPSFAKLIAGKHPACPVFDCDPVVANYYVQGCLEQENRSKLALKSYLYGVCDSFLSQAQLLSGRQDHPDVLHRMFGYIAEHFTENITLTEMGSALGYEPHYLSRVFGRAVGINVKQYINLYRIDYAKDRLQNSNDPVTDIALSCGFQSIRNFNRVFLAKVGVTPQAFRRVGE